MGILDEAKSLVKLAQQIDNKDLYAKILGLQSDLIALYEENIALREKTTELEKRLKVQADVVHEKNAYWMKKGEGQKDGPYCTKCLDDDGKLIRLPSDGTYDRTCPKCRFTVAVR